MKWQVTKAPAIPAIDAGIAMTHARIDDLGTEADWFSGYVVPNAISTCENEAQVSLITRTITATVYDENDSAVRGSNIRLPRGPVQSIVSVVDGNGSPVGSTSADAQAPGTTTVVFNFKAGPPGAVVPTDATSAVLCDPTGAFGIRRTDTGAVIVAANTALNHDGTGQYSYSFTDPAPGIVYEVQVKYVYNGNTYYDQKFYTASTPTDPNLYEIRRVGLNDFLYLKTQPVYPLTITYLAGYGDAPSDIPADLMGIMLAHVAFLYDNRSGAPNPDGLDRIFRRYRSFAL